MTTATHLLIHFYCPGDGPQPGTAEHDEEMRRWAELHGRLESEGVLVGGYALDDRGATVGPSGDVPWSAGRELLFAVHAVAVADDEAARALARKMPTADYGVVEVRPVMSGG